MPRGRLGELTEASERVVDLVLEAGGRTCGNGGLALASRAFVLFEAGAEEEAREVLDVLERHGPVVGAPLYLYTGAELLRPFVGLEASRRRLDELAERDRGGALSAALRLGAELPVRALGGEHERLAAMCEETRALARNGGMPGLACLADWADAVVLAREHGRAGEALERGRAAMDRLAAGGASYTSARLTSDLLALVPDAAGAKALAETTAARLDAMGARASASELRAAIGCATRRPSVRTSPPGRARP
jgi:hypothetical protein